ncbi:MAG TPA: response regulator [Pyrinomonadaceae bacterium]|jgi:signal transduction histidine kinase|nr:response regulator [Pyrinomonadaceae bacterium]
MNNPDSVIEQKQESSVPMDALTSRLNAARSPQGILEALAGEGATRPLGFDYCSLVLPAPDGKGIRTWRTPRSAETFNRAASMETLNTGEPFLAQVLSEGNARLLDSDEIKGGAANCFERDVQSALALPLVFGGRCFGLLCLASVRSDAYKKDDAGRLRWLADHVAAVAQAILLRERMEIVTEAEREIARLKSGFINTLVRDIRFPLTSVLGLLELFESKLQAREPFDMEDRQLLGSALENGDRMRRLLDDHLEVARQQDRPLMLVPEEVSVLRLLEDVAEPLRGEAALRGVELNVNLTARDLNLHADARQARRALCHILTVALDATRDGGAVQIEAQTITGTRVGDEGRRLVVINVTDSGEGIPAEEVPFVFDAFWQSSDLRTNVVRGVGLAIAKRVAAAHGGNVSVRSQVGVGTTYSIILPASQQASPRDTNRILIVDDVPEILLLLRKLVARMGHQVEIAAGAGEALEIMRAKRIDLLLTDWSMPGMNGGELIRALKRDERLSNIPTIVLTGHDTEVERSEARAAGCNRFLVKPIKRDELQRVIAELLATAAAAAADRGDKVEVK